MMVQSKLLQPAALDRFEKYSLTFVFSILAYRMISAFLTNDNWLALIYLFDQLIVIAFILLRKPTLDITQRPSEWLSGYGATFLALLIAPATTGAALAAPAVIGIMMLTGIALHLAAKLTLRRSFGVVAANRGVKGSGPYIFVRHPMYAGYIMVHAGVLLAGPNLNNIVVVLLVWVLFVFRIQAEERVLSRDPNYRALMERTPYRLVPGVY